MKRLLSIALAVVLILLMSGCTVQKETGQTIPSESEGPTEPSITEPYELKITDSTGQGITADLGTYEWNWDKGNGTWTGVCADSSHPLEWQEIQVPLVTSDDTVELNFAVQPNSFTITCWSEEYWGDTDAVAEIVNRTGNTIELKDGGYIYMVQAQWGGEGLSAYGNAIYSFYAVKDGHTHERIETAQTVDDPVTGYCGNTMTTVSVEDKEYTFMGSDSVNLTDILINLKYDPMRVCRCAPEFTVKTEFGEPYGVNLAQGYARCEEGQADLTWEQIALIQEILENQT